MYIYGRNPVIESLNSDIDIPVIYIGDYAKEGSIRKIYSLAREKHIIIKKVSKKKLDTLCENGNHQGVVAVTEDYVYYDFNQLLLDIRSNKQMSIPNTILVLDNIQDPHNFGAIIRTALGADVDAIVIQNRRSVQVTDTVMRVSSGSATKMKICKVTNINSAIKSLKNEGMWIYAMDMDGEKYTSVDMTGDVAIVVGNEGKGISELVKKNSDFVINIPLNPQLESLNASVASAVVMFEIKRQRG